MDQDETHDAARSGHRYAAGSDATAARTAGSARTIAVVAIIVALTAPFWEEAVLGSINIHMPGVRKLSENTLAIDRLERKTAELEQQLTAATAQIGKIQTQLTQTTGRASAAVDWVGTLAMVELGSALRRSGGFDLELAAVRTTVPGTDLKPLLELIEPYAVTGVPTGAQLRQEFARIGSRLEWSARSYVPVTWVNRLMPWQRGPVAPPDGTAQLLSQAGSQLATGDMAAAIATVQVISESHQDAFADWLEDAGARVAADSVIVRINDQIVQRAGAPTAQKAK